jgi:hypothetical protein
MALFRGSTAGSGMLEIGEFGSITELAAAENINRTSAWSSG